MRRGGRLQGSESSQPLRAGTHRPLDLAGHFRRADGARARREPGADRGSGEGLTILSLGRRRLIMSGAASLAKVRLGILVALQGLRLCPPVRKARDIEKRVFV